MLKIVRYVCLSLGAIALCNNPAALPGIAMNTSGRSAAGAPVAVSRAEAQAGAQASAAQLPRYEFPLWMGEAPGALGKDAKDIPGLTPYFAPPAKATGAAMIICPGGAYASHAPHEGFHYALWLNEQGFGKSP